MLFRSVPPSAPPYKMNVDGGVFMAQKSAGVGVLIRDSHGQVVAAISKKINAPLGPLEAEVKAWEEGVKFFFLHGLSIVVVAVYIYVCDFLLTYLLASSASFVQPRVFLVQAFLSSFLSF